MNAGTKAEKKAGYLEPEELARLTDTWEIWARSATSPSRAVSRARLHLFFLLARYGGLRSSEIYTFFQTGAIDQHTGLLRVNNRRLFLPSSAMRPLRRILALPEANEPAFLRLDAGFIRRSFYNVAQLANLPPDACAPRALRYGRALELLKARVSPRLIAESLGFSSPEQFLRIFEIYGDNLAYNEFPVIVMGLQIDYHSARVIYKYASDVFLEGVYSLEELAFIEPAVNKPATITIPPGLVFPSITPLPMANCLRCLVLSYVREAVEARIILSNSSGIELLATPDCNSFAPDCVRPGMEIDVYIPAHAIKLHLYS